MNHQNTPAAAALALAVLFPTYWVFSLAVGFDEGSLFEIFRADFERLNFWDGLFLLIGGLTVYVYLSLRKVLQQRLNSGLCSLLALILAIFVAAFTATVLLDVVLAVGQGMSESTRDGLLVTGAVICIALAVSVSSISLVFACSLLFGKLDAPVLLKVFAIILLLASLAELSLIFSFLSLVIYPLALVILAVFFLQDEHEVEVV